MAREATGEVRFIGGIWTCRIRAFGKRVPFKLPTCASEDDAEKRAALLSLLAKRFKLAKIAEKDAKEALDQIAAASTRGLRVAIDYSEELLGGLLGDIPGAEAPPTFKKLGEQWTSGE